MSKTIFILGAGASAQGGAPVMRDFLDVARDLWALGKVGDAKADFERVFNAISGLKVVYSNSRLDLTNIETLFAACEMAKTLRKFPGQADSQDAADSVLRSLRKLIVRTLEISLPFNLRKGAETRGALWPPEPYHDFALLIRHLIEESKPQHAVAVITFNYDIAADCALLHAGCPIKYGLDDSDQPAVAERVVPLLKLHGSISWGTSTDDPKKVVPLQLGKIMNQADFTLRDEGPFRWTVSKDLENAEMSSDPVLVPPTWNKADSHRALEKVWSSAAHELSDAENIFVIGYSMPETDSFFRHLYALGTVGSALLRRFWVFNPNKSVEPRFRDLLGPGAAGRFRFNAGGISVFRDAIQYLQQIFPST
jgi:hypothetical protein